MLSYESTSRLKPSAIRAIQQDVQSLLMESYAPVPCGYEDVICNSERGS